ncbi:MAG: hypothetical protein A3J97_02270 [Spirochaetes bacterium RIFOXYC1_FULL_54_7]|nr:MAG: hypothetical protein A3J97_02270 [Spirochaetes bacterium RIFOXYC1_FULL_54_7]
MISKERVRRALRRQSDIDRLPLEFDLSLSQIERFSSIHGIPIDLTPAYYEDLTFRISANELRTRMGSDCIVVGTETGSGFDAQYDSDGSYRNEFGMLMRQGPLYVDVVDHPLARISSHNELDIFTFPDPHDAARYVRAERDIARFGNKYFVIGDCEVTIFALARQLMGMEHCLISLMDDNDFMEPLFQRCLDWSLGVAQELAKRGVDAIWFGDDFGTQQSLIMSPDTFREKLKPFYTELIAKTKAVNPDLLVIFHSDGAVAQLIPDFIEMGVDVFNPVQPGVPGHEPEVLKETFGDRLAFFGAIDQQDLLPNATPEEVYTHVKSVMRVLGPDTGYMVAPAHIIQADTPRENVESFIQAILDT